MALATWWTTDPLPHISALPGFEVTFSPDDAALAQLNQLTLSEVQARRQGGHRPYLGFFQGTPVTYGWVATREASIGELGLTFRLPPGNRYLWDFAALPNWQGRGIYPRLLWAILERESSSAERFWIIHAPENLPSGAGMYKAGLFPIGQLSFRIDGGVGLAPLGSLERAQAGALLLGVPLVETVLAPCWCCGGLTEQRVNPAEAESCWPPLGTQTIRCICAIETKPPVVQEI
ncbi:MAG: GNAT family N-acetyltransferase [Chloroflexota bacterium]|nr:GNAT family N-acetyltransferase [Chloroflexota bacterium]